MDKLMPFQEEGVEFLKAHKHALLADDMGLGKTAQAIVAANELKANKILVICPASVKIHWMHEFRKWTDKPYALQIINKKSDKIYFNTRITIINYDLVISKGIYNQLIHQEFGVGICDEAHYLKNLTAKRTKAILGKKGILTHCFCKWMLTGTPILNRPIELFPILRTLASHTIMTCLICGNHKFRPLLHDCGCKLVVVIDGAKK